MMLALGNRFPILVNSERIGSLHLSSHNFSIPISSGPVVGSNRTSAPTSLMHPLRRTRSTCPGFGTHSTWRAMWGKLLGTSPSLRFRRFPDWINVAPEWAYTRLWTGRPSFSAIRYCTRVDVFCSSNNPWPQRMESPRTTISYTGPSPDPTVLSWRWRILPQTKTGSHCSQEPLGGGGSLFGRGLLTGTAEHAAAVRTATRIRFRFLRIFQNPFAASSGRLETQK